MPVSLPQSKLLVGIISALFDPNRIIAAQGRVGKDQTGTMTKVHFALPEPALVRLAVYNALGSEIRLLLSSYLPAGEHSAQWDGTDNHGNVAARGVYFYRLDSPSFHAVRKLVKPY